MREAAGSGAVWAARAVEFVVLFNKRCAQCSKAPAYSTRDHHPSTFPPLLQICSQTGIARATGFTTATAATA